MSSARFVFREAQPSEASAIAELIRRELPPELRGRTIYDCADIVRHVTENIAGAEVGADTSYHVAIVSGELAGCLEMQYSGGDFFLKYVAVAPAWRRHGIAQALLQAALRPVAAESRLRLHVLDTNVAALAWYQRIGLQVTGAVDWWQGELPVVADGLPATLGGYPQMRAAFETFGFANVTLQTERGSQNVGLLGEKWYRFGDWNTVSAPDIVAALKRLSPERRALVLSSTLPPEALASNFTRVAHALCMEGNIARLVMKHAP